MLAWAPWKNQQRQMGFPRKWGKKWAGGRGGLRQPEENSRAGEAAAGWHGAEEGLEQHMLPMDSPADAWQDQNLPWPGVLGWFKHLPAPEPSGAAAVWHRAATARNIFKPSSGA